MILKQEKLNVVDKTRSNIFNWRGQFTPEFIEYLLDAFAKATDTICDPFCGSGTVLLESARRNSPATGFEINPAAYAMAKFVTFARLPHRKRKELCDAVMSLVESLVGSYHDLLLFTSESKFRDRYRNFIQFTGELLSQIESKNEMVIALNALFHAESTGKGYLIPSIRRSFANIKQKLYDLPHTDTKLTAELCDARLAHEHLRSSVDLVITSPPYINVFNYHQNYRAIMEVLGFDILKVAASEIGSNRKNRGNRFRTVVQYALEMEETLASLGLCLKSNGTVVIVVGRESRVRGIPFSNSSILLQVAQGLGSYIAEMSHERTFTNRFGKQIKEDILVLRKKNHCPEPGSARSVALCHLKKGLSLASGDVSEDIAEAIAVIDDIFPSPLFSKKGII